MLDGLTKVIPILLLIGLGYLIQVKNWTDETSMHNLKRGILNLGLPAVLFIAFLELELKASYLLISVIIFVLMIVFFLVGELVNRLLRINSPVLAFITTGFAFGLLGIPLFGGVYGLENVGALSIFGIGHEFFAWFVYVTLVKQRLNGEKFSAETIVGFIKAPTIQAIIAGIVMNLLGWRLYFDQIALLKGIYLTISSLATITTPLILIVIGYGIKLEKKYIRPAIQMLAIRLMIVLGIGYLAYRFLIGPIVGGGLSVNDMAFYTFIILPPPFMIAIFVGEYSTKENTAIVSNAVVLATLSCIILFVGGVIITG